MNRYVLAQREAARAKRHRQVESAMIWLMFATFFTVAGVLTLIVLGSVAYGAWTWR
jgi:heme/copper-type cytochrome/quinol oxidase subunit 2